jgi:phosphate transport system permease protein
MHRGRHDRRGARAQTLDRCARSRDPALTALAPAMHPISPERPVRDFTRKRVRVGERVIESVLFLAAATSIIVTLGILYVLLSESAKFFSQVSIAEFLTGTKWTPLYEDKHYGIAPLLCGTLMSTLIAISVAVPLGLTASIYLSEFAGRRTREVIKPALELLAAVPTVIFGYFAFLAVTPFLRTFIPDLQGFNILSAGLVIGVMIIPYIASISEDAMRAVPLSLREGSFAIGATRLETAFGVVVPAAISGIASAFVLAMSRAVGETMVVAIAAGAVPQITIDPRQSVATITAFIAQVALGDLPHGSLEYESIFAAGLALMTMTLAFNLIAFWLNRRFREVY